LENHSILRGKTRPLNLLNLKIISILLGDLSACFIEKSSVLCGERPQDADPSPHLPLGSGKVGRNNLKQVRYFLPPSPHWDR
jgi:hypothetical protein